MTPRIATAAGFTGIGCGHTPVLVPEMPTIGAARAVLDKDHFLRDRSGGVSEEGLRAILEKPVRLDLDERLGVVQVSDSYRLERRVPLIDVPAEVTRSLDAAGLFRAWLYLTLVGTIVAPSRTLETAGVLEATLFDVRTGTVLFTVYERVRARADETPWHQGRKLHGMQLRLLHEAAGKLAEQVVSKVRYLAVARS